MTVISSTRMHYAAAASAALLALALSGCGGLSANRAAPVTVKPLAAIGGRVMGGQQPVSGATIQLYAVNAGTTRGAASPLLTQAVHSTSGGNFTITGLYTCPSGALVYLTATGGDAGAGTNSSLAMMAALGPCDNLADPTLFININELTTVASVYALAPFMADASHVGSSSSVGIANAFAMVNTLVNIQSGHTPGPAAGRGVSVPSAELNTLANIIATCINSSDSLAADCPNLFSLALPFGSSSKPSDTISALLNIASNPTNNVVPLFLLPSPASPFQPGLTAAPVDFTVAVNLTGPLASPFGVAIDAAGNAWVTNEAGFSVAKFSPQGNLLSGPSGFGSDYLRAPQGIAIDLAGNVWVANTSGDLVLELNPDGSAANAGAPAGQPGGVSAGTAPIDLAADARGNIWIADFGDREAGGYADGIRCIRPGGGQCLDPNGNPFFFEFTTNIQNLRPTAVAIDPNGNAWFSSNGLSSILVVGNNGKLISSLNGFDYAGLTDGTMIAPTGIVIDSSGNAWAAGAGSASLSGLSASAALIGGSRSTGNAPILNALTHPTGMAIDAADNIWVANSLTAGSLAKFAANSGDIVLRGVGTLNEPVRIAVDPSGNIWTANSGDNSVSILVGIATPTRTPVVARTH